MGWTSAPATAPTRSSHPGVPAVSPALAPPLLAKADFVTAARQYLLSQHGSASPSCPDPFNERPEPALLQRQSRSISVPTLSPAFTLSLAHDLSTCNSFELVFSRTDSTKCSHAEKHVHPSLDKDLNKWIKSRLGPDTISVQVEGAERQLLDVPSEYLGNCSYAYRFNLMNSGKAWVTAELLHEVRPSPPSSPVPATCPQALPSYSTRRTTKASTSLEKSPCLDLRPSSFANPSSADRSSSTSAPPAVRPTYPRPTSSPRSSSTSPPFPRG